MTAYYSPHTGEHIDTLTPADWMGLTALPVPAYNRKSQSAMFRDGAWVVEDAAPPAITYPRLTSLEMLDLFTPAEQLAVASAAMAVPEVKLWYDRMLAASYISLDDPRTAGGLDALVTTGLLTAARRDAVVGAMQP